MILIDFINFCILISLDNKLINFNLNTQYFLHLFNHFPLHWDYYLFYFNYLYYHLYYKINYFINLNYFLLP
jgi:hypothetical protein